MLFLLVAPFSPAEAQDRTVSGFAFPESAYWDAPTLAFYVSNFGGSTLDPNGRDEDGYISKLGADGQVTRWVTGLRSPKGIRRVADRLFVADVGQLVIIDPETAAIEAAIDLDAIGAKSPNDVAVDEASGDVYVSDMLRNAIYRIPAGTRAPEIFLESAELDSPNGLLVDGPNLVVATYGGSTDPGDPNPPTDHGILLLVDLATKAVSPLPGMVKTGRLDGIEKLDADYLVTDNPGGRLLRIAPDGSAAEVTTGLKNAADLGLRTDDRLAAVPELSGGTVRFLTV
ncbi:MAG: SMP-30/gluconolactonase/LRE family protein [Acidimicrobiia bacterium]